MFAFPSLMPPWLPEALPDDYDHFQGNFNCPLGSLSLCLLANLCLLEHVWTTSLWRLTEAGNFVMVSPTPLLQEPFSKSFNWLPEEEVLPMAQEPDHSSGIGQGEALSLTMKTRWPVLLLPGQPRRLGKCYPQRDLQQPGWPLPTDW